MEWKYATVFISSSFKDMHAERDYLIKEVFPELTEWCEKYKIRLSDVDLRWGVSEESSKNKKTIEKCLVHIDKSRPFFLCFLGQRRGWIPDFAKDVSEETINIFKGIEKIYDGKSATEMEIEYALLAPLYNFLRKKDCPPTKHSLFFLRDPDYINEITDAQRLIYTNDELEDADKIEFTNRKSQEVIDEIKARKRYEDKKSDDDESKVHIEFSEYEGTWNKNLRIPELREINGKYTNNEWQGRLTNFKVKDSGKPLKDVIIEQLKEQFKIAFSENFTQENKMRLETPLEKELNQQDIFCHLNSEGYIERTSDVNKLKKYIFSDENKICLVSSKAGYGKTMLLANFATYLEKEFMDKYASNKENKKHVFKRFCGVSDLSSNPLSLWQSIIQEAGIDEDYGYYPRNMDELKMNISFILDEISSGQDSIIIIDAVNQVYDGLNMLRWLPAPKSSNLKIIVSVKEDPDDEKYDKQLKMLKKRPNISNNEDYCFELEAFESNEDKRKLIDSYLKNYLKELSEADIKTICESPGSENPLYLKVLLAELRVFGSFEQLSDKIRSFGNSPKTAFKQVLYRLKDDERYTEGENIVELLFSLLASSRNGLSENEIVSIISSKINPEGDENKIKSIRYAVRLNLRQVRPFMARREGRHDFFYESFDLASQEEYENDEIKRHHDLASYFMSKADPKMDFSFNSMATNSTEILRPLNELPYHLNKSQNYKVLIDVLSSFSFIKNKLALSDIYGLISDYHFSQDHVFNQNEDHPIVLIGKALELSAPVLDIEKSQLSSQLWSRMVDIDDDVIQKLLEEINFKTSEKWLKSKTNSLYSPKSPIFKRVISDGKKSISAISLIDKNKCIIGTEDGILNIFDIEANELDILEDGTSKIIKIIKNECTILVANEDGAINEWDINNRAVIKEYPIIHAKITDIYLSKSYNKIYASSHKGIFSINLETNKVMHEKVYNANFNQIIVPRRNEAILVCDEAVIYGWDVYDMKEVYSRRHQQIIEATENFSTKMDSSAEVKFMGLNERFITLISEDGKMKFWNTLKNSGGGESIAETFVCGLNDKFAQAQTLEDANQIITISEMGVLRVWNVPKPKNPNYEKIIDIQTGIRSPTAIDYYDNGEDRWILIGDKNNYISFIDLNKKIEVSDIENKHAETVLSIKLHDNMISISESGEIFAWNFDEEFVQSKFYNDFRNECASYNYSENKLALAGIMHENNGLKVNKIATLKLADESTEENINPDDKVIDIAQNSSNMVFIEKNKLTLGKDSIELNKTPTTLATIFDKNDVFVGFEDGSIIKFPDENNFDKVNETNVAKIRISDDKLIAGFDDGAIEIFDLLGNHIASLRDNDKNAHEKAITNLNIYDAQLISVSEDNSLKLWDIENNMWIHTHFMDIYATAINFHNDKIVVGDALGNVRFFNYENFDE